MTDKSVQDILLYEVREMRRELKECREEIATLKMNVFSNKMKLGIFMAGITLFLNIVFIYFTEKVKKFI